jgi:uncharacterized protein YbaR (Trm112 family)
VITGAPVTVRTFSHNTLLVDKLVLSMAVSKELLDILVCPVCKADLILKEDGSGLKCVQCKRVYPIRDDIPIMLIDEATVES